MSVTLTLKKINNIVDKEYNSFLKERVSKDNIELTTEFLKEFKNQVKLLKESYFTLNNQYYDYSTDDSIGDHKSNLDIIFEWYIEKIKQSLQSEYFVKELKKNWLKYLVKNYYILDPYQGDKESLEKDIKIYLNYNYQFIQKEDEEEFTNAFFRRNFTFISDTIRYFYIIEPEFKQILKSISKQDFQKYLEHIKERKKDLILDINQCSLNEKKSIKISNAFFLFDIDAFDKKNTINTIILEYLSKVLNNKLSKEKLIRKFGNKKIKILSFRISNNINYIEHIQKIKNKKEKPYFNNNGMQVDNKLEKLLKGIDISDLEQEKTLTTDPTNSITTGHDKDENPVNNLNTTQTKNETKKENNLAQR